MFTSLTKRLLLTYNPRLSDNFGKNLETIPIFFKKSFDSEFQKLLERPHYLPCLSYVIQLAVKIFLAQLKIKAKNNDIDVY